MPNSKTRKNENAEAAEKAEKAEAAEKSKTSSDCLICLDPIRQPWHPGKPCVCRPLLHKRCWDEWTSRGNAVCIICRDVNIKEIQVYQYQIIRYNDHPVQNRCTYINQCMSYLMNFVLFLIILYVLSNTITTINLMSEKDEL
jgi:hypothetical protein